MLGSIFSASRDRFLLLASVSLTLLTIAGCGSGEPDRIMATEPQAANQQARTRDQEIEHMTKLLGGQDDGKVKRALYWLNEWANEPGVTKAIPTLEKVAKGHAKDDIKKSAQEVLDKILAAKK